MPLITSEQNERAKSLSSKITNSNLAKNAYLDFAAEAFFSDFMIEDGFFVNTKRSLFKNTRLYSDFSIVDVYCNYHKYYLLTSFDFDSVKIPKKHKEYDILPEAYIVIKIDEFSNRADILGFFEPDETDYHEEMGDFYLYKIDKLKNITELKEKIKQKAELKHAVGSHINCIKLFENYIKNQLSEDEKKNLILHIMSCESCKKKLVEMLDLAEPEITPVIKQDYNNEIKDVIDTIYKNKELEIKDNDTFKYTFEFPYKLKKPVVLTGAIFLILAILIMGVAAASSGKKKVKDKEVQGLILDGDMQNYDEEQGQNYDIKLPPVRTNKGYAAVSKVSWEVSSNLNKDEYKKFLQQTGKTIRLNLQNDLLLSNEAIINSRVKFEMKFYRDGNLESLDVLTSSGSGAVDNVIKQSIENTMQYMKPPKGAFVGNRNSLILNIDF